MELDEQSGHTTGRLRHTWPSTAYAIRGTATLAHDTLSSPQPCSAITHTRVPPFPPLPMAFRHYPHEFCHYPHSVCGILLFNSNRGDSKRAIVGSTESQQLYPTAVDSYGQTKVKYNDAVHSDEEKWSPCSQVFSIGSGALIQFISGRIHLIALQSIRSIIYRYIYNAFKSCFSNESPVDSVWLVVTVGAAKKKRQLFPGLPPPSWSSLMLPCIIHTLVREY